MKRTLFAILIAAALGLAAPAPASVAVSVTVGGFYDELAPYGHWVTVARWGHCWRPASVSAIWQPYSNGEWLLTDYGRTWVSYDPWGSDPYHYGGWVWDPEYGWIWVPGTVWAPAWVTWCYTDTYIGWAPLPPSFSISYSGYAGPAIVEPARSYVFVPAPRFVGTSIASVRIAPARNAAILPSARGVTRLAVSGGIVRNTALAPAQVERLTGRRVSRVSLSRARTRAVSLDASGVSGRRFSVAAPAAVRRSALGPRRRSARAETAPAAPVVKQPVQRARGRASANVPRSIERPRPSRPERLERPAVRREAPRPVTRDAPVFRREPPRPAARREVAPPRQALSRPATSRPAPRGEMRPAPAPAARAPQGRRAPQPQARGGGEKRHGAPR